MSKIYTRSYQARFSEINAAGQLAPSDYARYIIDTAYEWGESLGLGYSTSVEQGLYWIILETEIQFFSPLHFRDEFDFTIWMLEWKRVRGMRAFVLQHKKDGKKIAQGRQQIACMDSQTQRPVSPPEHLIDNFKLDAPPEIPSQRFPKIPVLPENSLIFPIQVAWQDVDILGIVNNAVFVAYAEEAVTRTFASFGWSPNVLKSRRLARTIRRMHVQYHQPAVWGDTLNCALFSLQPDENGGSFYISIRRATDDAAIASCILDWGLSSHSSEEAQPLPAALLKALQSTGIAGSIHKPNNGG